MSERILQLGMFSSVWMSLLVGTLCLVLFLLLNFSVVLISFRNRKKIIGKIFLIVSLTVLIAFVYIYRDVPSYLWALHLETKWKPIQPKTRTELETKLSLYSKHIITTKESSWGKNYELGEDEHMEQYLLLWQAPLDVVYDKNDAIVRIFTSYE